MSSFKITLTLLLIFLSSSSLAEEVEYVYKVPRKGVFTEPIIVHQPNGPFAAMVFPEDAVGNYLGIILYDLGKQPPENTIWDLSDRFWQERKWASDITSFAWGPSGKYLYVATSEIYGDGGIFRLNILQKKATKIYPTEETCKKLKICDKCGYDTEILELNGKKMRVKLEFYDEDAKVPTEIESVLPIE